MVRCAFGLVATLLAAGACDNGKHHLHPEAGRDAPPPPWWQPLPGTANDWDIQLAASPNLSAPRAMYALDLWEVVPAPTMLDYGDGAPVTVPAGSQASAIATLHGRTPPAMVVCHVTTGAIRLDDPDAMKFPGYAASPPDRPNALAAGSVIGWSPLGGDPNLRFLDIHDASRAKVVALIAKRLELAKTIGCDAVTAEVHDLLSYQTTGHGFENFTPGEYETWSDELTERAHEMTLSMGLRSSTGPGVGNMVRRFDWLMTDRCAEFGDCSVSREFINARKAVFAIEYVRNEENTMDNDKPALCGELADAMIEDELIKDAALSSAVRDTCP